MTHIRKVGFVVGVLFCLHGIAARTAHAAPFLTGLISFGTTDSGNADGPGVWNTLGGDARFNLWVVQGPNPFGPFINGPTDALASISIDLPDGIHRFHLFGDSFVVAPTSHFGLNLFFDGDNVNPGISVYGTESPAGPFVFFPNSGMTLTLAAAPVPGAGTLSFLAGSTRVTLVEFSWFSGLSDRVSPFTATPNMFPDYIGAFTIQVETVPEPSTLALCALGAFSLLVRHRGRRPPGMRH